jgi:hypothetical protein
MAVAVVSVLVVLLGHREAHAQSQSGAVLVTGKADNHARQVITSTIEGAVRQAAWSLSPLPLSPAEVDKLTACLAADRPWPCISANALAKGAERLVIVQTSTERSGTVTELVLTGELVVADDSVPSIERQSCVRCSDDELARISKLLAMRLLDNTASRGRGPILDVKTTPPRASIAIDDQPVGQSDRTFLVGPGSHRVTITLPGYRSETRFISTAEGKTTPLSVALQPDEGDPHIGHRSRLIPAIVIGGGLVAAVVGSVISYSAEPGPRDQRHKYIYSSPAIGMAVAGGVAIGVGAYLWFRPVTTSTPTVALLPGGAFAGWASSF